MTTGVPPGTCERDKIVTRQFIKKERDKQFAVFFKGIVLYYVIND